MNSVNNSSFTRTTHVWLILAAAACAWLGTSAWALRLSAVSDTEYSESAMASVDRDAAAQPLSSTNPNSTPALPDQSTPDSAVVPPAVAPPEIPAVAPPAMPRVVQQDDASQVAEAQENLTSPDFTGQTAPRDQEQSLGRTIAQLDGQTLAAGDSSQIPDLSGQRNTDTDPPAAPLADQIDNRLAENAVQQEVESTLEAVSPSEETPSQTAARIATQAQENIERLNRLAELRQSRLEAKIREAEAALLAINEQPQAPPQPSTVAPVSPEEQQISAVSPPERQRPENVDTDAEADPEVTARREQLAAAEQELLAEERRLAEQRRLVEERRLEEERRIAEEQFRRQDELSVLAGLSARLRFDYGSAEVSRQQERTLDRLFDPLFLYAETPVLVTVASNESDDPTENDRLSIMRGESVVKYLVDRGLEPGRFRVDAIPGDELQEGTHRIRVSVPEEFVQ